MVSLPPEKLGSFYLGAKYNSTTKQITEEAINYDSRDLTTHAICVGMTGSGKTGLCIGLLEEAAIDKVPAIIIDPKGDMTNLLLQFQNLDADEFKKWINPDDAGRKGMTVDDYASATASKWKNGLADWGQDLDRIALLKNAVDYTIYTPGSDSGVSINIMGSFAAPGIDFDDDAEMLRERIQGTVAALLGMVELKADPVRSREGILLSNLFEHYWRLGEDIDLAKLIMSVQSPPMKKLGVFDMDTFFPEKDRFDLAMSFNTLMASPQFQYWLQGEDLDIEKIYFTAEGKPRHSIFYIAHLSDSERMFFVTLLLNSVIGWMRRQSGTTSLRSLVYFDEIFGYFPPTAEPPSKKPLLTLLKQARAFGVGCVLVTQNPVDIDYKGISNAGTWFIGKLQTERDKMRVLDGLKGALAEAGTTHQVDFDELITSLGSRVFLMHNVHESTPVLYHTRWVMSYLRGPLTRPQVKTLMSNKKISTPAYGSRANSIGVKSSIDKPIIKRDIPPSIDHNVTQKYFAVWKSASEAKQEMTALGDLRLHYQPHIVTTASVRFYDEKRRVDVVQELAQLCSAPDKFGRVEWEESLPLNNWQKMLFSKPDHPDNISVSYEDVPDSANSAKEISKIEKEYSDWLYRNKRYYTLEHDDLDIYQASDETEESFRMRVQQRAREERDEELDELQDKYETKFDRIREKIRKEQQDLDEAQSEVRDRRTAEMVGMAETIFSVFVKKRSRSFSSAASKSRMRRKAKQKLEESKDDLEELHLTFDDLEKELQEKLSMIRDKWDHIVEGVTKKEVKPRRTDVAVDHVFLSWLPFWIDADGNKVSALK